MLGGLGRQGASGSVQSSSGGRRASRHSAQAETAASSKAETRLNQLKYT